MSTAPTVSLLHVASRVWRLLDTSQRRRCVLVLLISTAAACFTVVGVAGVLLDGSVAENVAFKVPADSTDFERVRQVVADARLGALVDAMPEGVATLVGQNGVQLSGGQRQRLGIARALYRPASLVVMDEATSSLDTLTEAEVVGLLEALRGRCTTIVIGHRASALPACDLLLELEGGRVVGSASPADWLREPSGIHRAAESRR